jgi:hypothetical protein
MNQKCIAYTYLTIKAHQHTALNRSIALTAISGKVFALFASPNRCKIECESYTIGDSFFKRGTDTLNLSLKQVRSEKDKLILHQDGVRFEM